MMRQCPVCKLDNQNSAERDYGDKVTYDCSRCGRYTITGSAKTVAERKNKSAELSGWLREKNLQGIEIDMLTKSFLEDVLKTLPNYGPLEKQNKLLKAIEKLTKYPGAEVPIVPEYDTSLAWAENEQEFNYYMKSLVERGLLEIPNEEQDIAQNEEPRTWSGLTGLVVLTVAGQEYLKREAIQSDKVVDPPTWMYHEPKAPDGQIFKASEVPGLEKAGWVDTPTKFGQGMRSHIRTFILRVQKFWLDHWKWIIGTIIAIAGIIYSKR